MAKQKILFIGDTLSSLKLISDTSIAFCEAALKLDFEVFWCEKKDVSFLNYEIVINQPAIIHNASTDNLEYTKYIEEDKNLIKFCEFAYCFIRPNPPFDESYLNLCWILNTQTQVKIFNHPSALLNFHEKSLHLRAFSENILTEKNIISTCISQSLDSVKLFIKLQNEKGIKEFVTKPWLGYGGSNILLWNNNERMLEHIRSQPEQLMVQPFLENIHTDGDRRVLIVNGKIACSFVRIPPSGSITSNTASGGVPQLRDLTDAQMKLCHKIANFTLQHNIVLAGVDLIGEQVGEINITSPTGFRIYETLTKESVILDSFKEIVQ